MDAKSILIIVGGEFGSKKDAKAVLSCGEVVEKELAAAGYDACKLPLTKKVFAEDAAEAREIINRIGPDCIINFFEGFEGNAGAEADFAKVLKDINIPFTGNMPEALKNCLDKHNAKKMLKDNGVSVPDGHVVSTLDDIEGLVVPFPAFIKPRCEDASIGIDRGSFVSTQEELYPSIENKLNELSGGLIVEEFIGGAEFNASYMGEYPYELVGISKLDYSEHEGCVNFLTYDSKWEESSDEYRRLMPEVVTGSKDSVIKDINRISVEAGRALGCGGYFRVDLREKDGKLFVIDVNPNPDISKDSGFARQAKARGLSYVDVIEKIISLAMEKNSGG
jgi:D-alanine-D-alanine ligase